MSGRNGNVVAYNLIRLTGDFDGIRSRIEHGQQVEWLAPDPGD